MSGAYVEFGALATAPGPLAFDRARLYTFVLRSDRERTQALLDRVFDGPSGGAVRYRLSPLAPVVLSFGVMRGRSTHPDYKQRGTAVEHEAAVWLPVLAEDHLAMFMPYVWVDDPIALSAGREIYGFAKTQGWITQLDLPPDPAERTPVPDPPEELVLDVHGTAEYSERAAIGRVRLVTVTRSEARRGGPLDPGPREGEDLASLAAAMQGAVAPAEDADELPRRSMLRRVASTGASFVELATDQIVRHAFLKQIRDAADARRAALQQIVETRSAVTPGSLRWRRLPGEYEVRIERLASQPLLDELGLEPVHRTRLGFAVEFGFTMEPGEVLWSST